MWKVPLFDLDYGNREKEAVIEVLDSKWLSAGPKVDSFEKQFAAYLGRGVECCAVSNCTAALSMALSLAGVGREHEVILSGHTFVADLNVVAAVGAKPVLADSKSLDDWNISPQSIAKKITPSTKAVIAVHFAGYPCDMTEIISLCEARGIVLIEDVAHAIGGEYKAKKCGTMGEIGCFSFFSNKNLSTGEGGMLVSRDPEIIKQARLLRSHGMTSLTYARHQGNAKTYDVLQPGFNYRLDEIHAALGIVQLEKLDTNNEKRKVVVDSYRKSLASLTDIEIPWKYEADDRLSSYHIFPVLLHKSVDRSHLMNFMQEKGIQTSIHYPAFSSFSYYQDYFDDSNSNLLQIANRCLTLPLYPTMADDDVQFVVSSLFEYFDTEEKTS